MTPEQLLAIVVQASREGRLDHGMVDGYVCDLCRCLGLGWMHITDSRRSKATGWPDYVITGRRMIFREYKQPGDILRPAQQRWRYRILAAGGDWGLWIASMVIDGHVESELKGIT
jgi:hypothetical protein